MKPDYSKYTIQELNEVCTNIDKDSYPERYEAAKTQLESKLLSQFKELKEREKLVNYHASDSHKVTIKSHLREMLPTIIILFLSFALWVYFSVQRGLGWQGLHSIFILVWCAIALIPQSILHLRYWQINNNYRIEQKGTTISIFSDSVSHNFKWEDIETIHLYLPTSQYFSGSRIIPSENYSFGKVKLKGVKKEVAITSLLDQDLLWLHRLKPSVTERHWRVFALV